jgi:hypothetical protein
MSLDDRVEVKRSPIHGRGLFARRRFRRSAYIATFEGKQTRKNGTHVLWVMRDDGSEIGIEGSNALRYLNHSSKPNAEFRGADLHAVRTIGPGEELTIDYGPDWDDE